MPTDFGLKIDMEQAAKMFTFLDARVGKGDGYAMFAPDYLMKRFRIERGLGRTIAGAWVKTYTSRITVNKRIEKAFGRGR